MREIFQESVPQWVSQLDQTRNLVRQELVQRQLGRHLVNLELGALIVDVGCGQGTVSLALARQGYRVIGIDPSDELLDIARNEAEVDEKINITYMKGALDELQSLIPEPADVICCHGVLMYLPELKSPVAKLVEVLRPGGLVSLLTRNQASIAFRAGMMKKWDEALSGFETTHFDNRVGAKDVRADTPQQVIAACESAGATLEEWYGVRLFTDHWDDVPPPKDMAKLLDAEEAAGQRDPYRQLTSLTHVLARRS